jgi:hypothetical protein
MHPVLIASSAMALVVAGCATQDPDPFTSEGTSVYFTMECVAKADGECVKFTCKADATSDCAGFANGCVDGGNHYSGTSDGGACSKVL